jgi:hypothetical protein
MWLWITNLGGGIKSALTIISRVMKLETRVTELEEKIKTLQMPPKDIREGLSYNRILNVYDDKVTGESFCSTCLGNKKRVAVQTKNNYGQQYWGCYDCKSTGSDGKEPQYPRHAGDDYNPLS